MQKVSKRAPQWLRDLGVFILVMGGAVGICMLLSACYDDNNPFATSVFILAVVLISRFTNGYLPGVLAAAVGVVGVNYLFTYPFHEFNLSIDGYPLTFAVMLVVSVLVSTLTTQIKRQEQLRYEAEKDRMRANLLRSVSHDIRTPLAAIMGLSATVEEGETLSDEGRGMVEEIRRKTTRNGSMMAYVTLEDDTAAMELLTFSNVLERSGSLLTENAAVVAEGRISVRDEKSPQLVVNRFDPLEAFTKQAPPPMAAAPRPAAQEQAVLQASRLYLRLPSEQSPLFGKVRATLNMFPGNVTAVLYFVDTGVRRGTQCGLRGDMLQELRAPAHRPAESLEKRCERIYRSWGLSTYDANKRYLTGALRMMMGSDHRLAIRKEILGPVAEEYNLTVAAVDSALRRLLETLDETGTQTWRDFRKEYGLERRKVTIGRLLYALESKLSQQ